jgi:hypothetical protein
MEKSKKFETQALPGTTERAVNSEARAVLPTQTTVQSNTAVPTISPVRRTDAQAIASRRNGAKSLGPSSASGKSIASRNALTHGLTASSVAGANLGEPERDRFTEYFEGFMREFQATTLSERIRAQDAALQQILLEKTEASISRLMFAEGVSITPVLQQIESHVGLLGRIITDLESGLCSTTAEESRWICETVDSFYKKSRGQLREALALPTLTTEPTPAQWNDFREALAGKKGLPSSERAMWRVRLRDTVVELERELTPLQKLKIHDRTAYEMRQLLEKLPDIEKLVKYADHHRRTRDKQLDKLAEKMHGAESIEVERTRVAIKSKGAETVVRPPDEPIDSTALTLGKTS